MDDTVYMDKATAAALEEVLDRMVLVLKTPLVVNASSTITELHLSEPTAGQWLQASAAAGPDGDLQLLAIVAKVPAAVLRAMAISDFTRAVRFLAGFANVSQEAGKA